MTRTAAAATTVAAARAAARAMSPSPSSAMLSTCPTSSFRWTDSRHVNGSWEANGRYSCCFALGFNAVVSTSVSNHRGRVSRFLLPMEVDTVFGSGASLLNHCQTQILLCNELTGLLLAADVYFVSQDSTSVVSTQSSGMYCRWI
ncbi:unnamed protein product [Ectocarpus sp. 12 AP-2014]